MKKHFLLFPSILIITQLACIPSIKIFNVIDKNVTYKDKSLAVVAGMDNKATKTMANYLTEYLEKNTKFRVMSQNRVSRAIPNYPVNIKGPYQIVDRQIKEDYSLTDIKKLKKLNKRIKADYIYIVWIPVHIDMTVSRNPGYIGQHQNGVRHDHKTQDEIIDVINQFYEFPEGKQLANGKHMVIFPKKGYTYLPGQVRWDSIYHVMREWCYSISIEVGQKTGMVKDNIEKFDREKYREKK